MAMLKTLPITSRGPLAAFEDQWREVADVPLEITGRLPDALAGTLYRVGPTAFHWPKGSSQHWFDGHGQVQAIALANGQARYTSRFVQTPALATSRQTGAPVNGYGTHAPGLGRFRRPGSTANTNIFKAGERVLVLQEMSLPWALDAHSLATLGEDDLGCLKAREGFSAHPRVVGDRIVSANLEIGRQPRAHVTVLGKDLQLAHAFRLDLPYTPALLHDIGVSEKHVVIPVFPQVTHPLGLLFGLQTLGYSSRWQPERGSLLLVADHQGERVRRYELPAMWSFHVLNCFDEGDTVVVDLVTYASGAALADIGRAPFAPPATTLANRLQRVRLYADGRHTIETLLDTPSEFPRVAPAYHGKPYRHGFLVGARNQAPQDFADFNGVLLRLDLEAGTTQRWEAPQGHIVGEGVPVPMPGAGPDDVWLLSLVYDPAVHQSYVAVLDGRQLDAGPLATLQLPHHVPPGFHGSFASGRET